MSFETNRGYTTPISVLRPEDFSAILKLALEEDAPQGDITSDSIFSPEHTGQAKLVSREVGILCGISILEALSTYFPKEFHYAILCKDGTHLVPGQIIAEITGSTRVLFRIERILLNFLQYLSGIASTTSNIVSKYPNLRILDTRKTLPAYRTLVKYAVFTGGGWNHRIHLSDMAMIKDNHIAALGSISKAVEAIRTKHPEIKIEIELDRLDQLHEALGTNPDIILLDNFSIKETEIAVTMIQEKNTFYTKDRPSSDPILIEASGNITPDKLAALSLIGGIGVSMGYLTHTTRFLDIGLDMVN